MKVILNNKPTKMGMDVLQQIADGENWLKFSDGQLWEANKVVAIRQPIPCATRATRRLISLSYHTRKRDGLDFLKANRKTGDSIEVSPDCPYNCTYCYVNNPVVQVQIKNRFEPVDPAGFTPTKQQAFINYLEKRRERFGNYFLRALSLADCPPEYLGLLEHILYLCQGRVPTVVITKDADVVRMAYPLASQVLYSVDIGTYSSPSSVKQYVELTNQGYERLRVFAMIADWAELRLMSDYFKRLCIPEYRTQYVAFHGAKSCVGAPYLIKPKFLHMLTKGKACCINGHCISCPIKCGLNEAAGRTPSYTLIPKGG